MQTKHFALTMSEVMPLSYLIYLSTFPPLVRQTTGVLGAIMLYQLCYVSRAVTPMSYPELRSLVTHARTYNSSHDITGVLFYGEGNFAQVLEGEQEEVERLYERIQQDPRHYDVTVITRVNRPRRTYAQWSMAGHRLAEAQFAELVKHLPKAAEDTSEQPLGTHLEAFIIDSQPL